MVHGFLAVMGGIAIEIEDNNPGIDPADRILNFFPMKESTKGTAQRTRLTLTPNGLKCFKTYGTEELIPKLQKKRIQDKSKGVQWLKHLSVFKVRHFPVSEVDF